MSKRPKVCIERVLPADQMRFKSTVRRGGGLRAIISPFSSPADIKNGENLLVLLDRRITVSYVVEAIHIFDHYHFRVAQQEAKKAKRELVLAKPPRNSKVNPWWDEDYTDVRKIRDRELRARFHASTPAAPRRREDAICHLRIVRQCLPWPNIRRCKTITYRN